MTPDNTNGFPLKEARQLARGLYTPRPAIYWTDFLVSVSLGWAAFAVALIAAPLSTVQLVATLLAVLALYRSVVFTHEISHFPRGAFRGFQLAWNLLCGLPLMAPSFMYRGVHMEHHRARVYGTGKDGEYLPFAVGGRLGALLYLLQPMVLPLLVAVRFLVLSPLAWLSPAIRRLVWRRASSLAIDSAYERPLESMAESNDWRWQEAGVFFFGVAVLALVAGDLLPVTVIVLWYLVMSLILLLNAIRTLAAHRYRNPGDRSMTVEEQFLDSVDVPGHPLITPLWAPVGLRYHATHHLFPAMPYHNLGKAYRKLAAELSDSQPYLEATRSGLRDALCRLWREAGPGR